MNPKTFGGLVVQGLGVAAKSFGGYSVPMPGDLTDFASDEFAFRMLKRIVAGHGRTWILEHLDEAEAAATLEALEKS